MEPIARTVTGLGEATTNCTFFDGAVTEFRGIPYATVTQRFRRAKLADAWQDGRLDASHYG